MSARAARDCVRAGRGRTSLGVADVLDVHAELDHAYAGEKLQRDMKDGVAQDQYAGRKRVFRAMGILTCVST
jgi:hypothetical protein